MNEKAIQDFIDRQKASSYAQVESKTVKGKKVYEWSPAKHLNYEKTLIELIDASRPKKKRNFRKSNQSSEKSSDRKS